jgi:hypothetical protein
MALFLIKGLWPCLRIYKYLEDSQTLNLKSKGYKKVLQTFFLRISELIFYTVAVTHRNYRISHFIWWNCIRNVMRLRLRI